MQRHVIRTVRFTTLAIILILTTWYLFSPSLNSKKVQTQLATVIEQRNTPLSPFKLVDSNGNQFTEASLRGHWSLLFFGYTKCPDVCPATLSLVREAWKGFDNKYPARFIFASINPTEDDPKDLKAFLGNYHREFMGITGPSQEMAKLSGQLNIIAEKNNSNPDGITRIDHTAALMLIDPKGRLKAIFTPPLDPAAIVNDINAIANR